jgi:hypothetical protein
LGLDSWGPRERLGKEFDRPDSWALVPPAWRRMRSRAELHRICYCVFARRGSVNFPSRPSSPPAKPELFVFDLERMDCTFDVMLPSDPGTYALLFQCDSPASVDVGRLGRIKLVRGHYIYVGSAFGQGGVRARVARHWRPINRAHWHIGYLRGSLKPVGVWVSFERKRLDRR